MELTAKKEALLQLGEFFQNCINQYHGTLVQGENSKLNLLQVEAVELIDYAKHENGWFTPESVLAAMEAWANALKEDKVDEWLERYTLEVKEAKKVGIIMAGNIPFVGLHDVLCTLIAEHKVYAKLSSKDKSLMTLAITALRQIAKEWDESIIIAEQLKEIDILIATGSDNSARYFDYYFKDKKRLIRKNRTSVAVLDGKESEEDLGGFAKDIFTHFGLGCRNITKVYVPENYDLDHIFKALFPYQDIASHNKYSNNYDYNKAVYLLNKIELIENGFILFKEDSGLHSPVGVLFYEYYQDINQVREFIEKEAESIQCIVSNIDLKNAIDFGKAQKPEIWDYADGIDTIDFLLKS